jgi:hypothetical protein
MPEIGTYEALGLMPAFWWVTLSGAVGEIVSSQQQHQSDLAVL